MYWGRQVGKRTALKFQWLPERKCRMRVRDSWLQTLLFLMPQHLVHQLEDRLLQRLLLKELHREAELQA